MTSRDMRDAHETARERDALAKAGHPIEWFFYDETQTFTREHLTEALHVYLAPANPRPGDVVQYLGHATTQARDAAWMLGALDGTSGPRDRTHDDQETDTMTDQPEPYDFHDEAHRALLNDKLSKGWQAGLHALLAIDDTLTEILDRLPERPPLYTLEGVAAEFGVDCCPDPAPADVDPDEALAITMFVAQTLTRPGWDGMAQRGRDNFLAMARAAREYIEDEGEDDIQIAHSVGYEAGLRKAEANLARVTKERDERADRYDALRADVVSLRDGWRRQGSGWTKSLTAVAADQVDGILVRDTERAES